MIILGTDSREGNDHQNVQSLTLTTFVYFHLSSWSGGKLRFISEVSLSFHCRTESRLPHQEVTSWDVNGIGRGRGLGAGLATAGPNSCVVGETGVASPESGGCDIGNGTEDDIFPRGL